MASKFWTVAVLCAFWREVSAQQTAISCNTDGVSAFADPVACILPKLQQRKIRVMYIEAPYFIGNNAAQQKAAQLGIPYTCIDPKHSVGECFVASNWRHGWIGAFFYGILFNYLSLKDEDIIAMTLANCTGQTDPANKTSGFYKGVSIYSRCAWEIRYGNVDLCVGNSRETTERRSIAEFTTSYHLDQLLLLSTTLPSSSAIFDFGQFDSSNTGNIFMPLTWQAWAMHVAMITLCGVTIWAMEATSPSVLAEKSPKWRNRVRRASSTVGGILGHQDTFNSRSWKLVQGAQSNEVRTFDDFLTSIYASWHVFFWNGPFHRPRTAGAKIAQFALSFYVLIVTATYTASLAGYLATATSLPVLVQDFSHFLDEQVNHKPFTWDGKICVPTAWMGLFDKVVNPQRLVGVDTASAVYEGIIDRRCSAVITGQSEYRVYVQASMGSGLVCPNTSDPVGNSVCVDGSSLSVDFNLCPCKSNPTIDAATCQQQCPYYNRFHNLVPINQDGFAEAYIPYNFALPVASELNDLISYAILKSRANGDVTAARVTELEDQCPIRFDPDGDPTVISHVISVKSIVAVYILAIILAGVGIILHILQKCLGIKPSTADPLLNAQRLVPVGDSEWDVAAAAAERREDLALEMQQDAAFQLECRMKPVFDQLFQLEKAMYELHGPAPAADGQHPPTGEIDSESSRSIDRTSFARSLDASSKGPLDLQRVAASPQPPAPLHPPTIGWSHVMTSQLTVDGGGSGGGFGGAVSPQIDNVQMYPGQGYTANGAGAGVGLGHLHHMV